MSKQVTYSIRGVSGPPFSAEQLVPSSRQTFVYDDLGQQIRAQTYSPVSELSSYSETAYLSDGTRVRGAFTANRTRVWTTWTFSSGRMTVARFDDHGRRTVALRGFLAKGEGLANGWGLTTQGVACSLAASRAAGHSSQIRLYATLRNLSHRSFKVPTRPHYLTVVLRGGQTERSCPSATSIGCSNASSALGTNTIQHTSAIGF